MRVNFKSPILPAGVILAAVSFTAAAHLTSPADSIAIPTDVSGVVTLEALEYVASEQPADWAAVADVVVVAKATHEKAHAPAQSETTVDSNLIGRTVTVEPTETIWRAAESKRELPKSIDLTASGWVTNDGETSEVNLGYGSRVEVGHTYVLALVWAEEICGEDPQPAEWAIIGSEGALPIDDGVVGKGEIGAAVKASVDVSTTTPGSVLALAAGKSSAAVGAALDSVEDEVKRVPFRATNSNC